MNSVHDMGGMDGFGPIETEENELVFHDVWEGRMFGLFSVSAGVLGPWHRGRNFPWFRFSLESIPPEAYLRMSYYERWLEVLSANFLRGGLISERELENWIPRSRSATTQPTAWPDRTCTTWSERRAGLRHQQHRRRPQSAPARTYTRAPLCARQTRRRRHGQRRLGAPGYRRAWPAPWALPTARVHGTLRISGTLGKSWRGERRHLC